MTIAIRLGLRNKAKKITTYKLTDLCKNANRSVDFNLGEMFYGEMPIVLSV